MPSKCTFNCFKGNVVLHYKRYSKDQLPNSEDPTTYLLDEDKYGILVLRVCNNDTVITSYNNVFISSFV